MAENRMSQMNAQRDVSSMSTSLCSYLLKTHDRSPLVTGPTRAASGPSHASSSSSTVETGIGEGNGANRCKRLRYSVRDEGEVEAGLGDEGDEGLLNVDDYFSIRFPTQGKKPLVEADESDEDGASSQPEVEEDIVERGNMVMNLVTFRCTSKKKCTSRDIKLIALDNDRRWVNTHVTHAG